MARKIWEVADKFISPDQYAGDVGDRVYGHYHGPELLEGHYGQKGFHTHDEMHQAALVGTAMKNPKAKPEHIK